MLISNEVSLDIIPVTHQNQACAWSIAITRALGLCIAGF